MRTLAALLAGALLCAPAPPFTLNAQGAPRVVAIGDIHGSLDGLTRILKAAGLTSNDGHWAGGRTQLIQTGDYMDRGEGTRAVLDLLIANIDRNQGNLIYDEDWHLFLIDHSRAFTGRKDLKGMAPLGRVDRQLWAKMAALTLEDLDRGLGDWVGAKEKKALLLRRDKMAEQIKQMIAKRGESVFYD